MLNHVLYGVCQRAAYLVFFFSFSHLKSGEKEEAVTKVSVDEQQFNSLLKGKDEEWGLPGAYSVILWESCGVFSGMGLLYLCVCASGQGGAQRVLRRCS